MVAGLMSKFAASKEELRDIRAQHGDLSREADQTRDRLARELEEARASVESLTGERDGLSEKVIKYKGQVVSLTQDLEQYKDNQEQLEKRVQFVHEQVNDDAIAEEFIEGRELQLEVGDHVLVEHDLALEVLEHVEHDLRLVLLDGGPDAR